MSTALDQVCARLAVQVRDASDRDRGAAVRQAAASLGVDPDTIYAHMRKAGWSSGRKKRADAGISATDRAALVKISELMAKGRNKRGQPNVTLRRAHAIAVEQGWTTLSYEQIARLLRRAGLDMATMCAPEAAIQIRSEHPNHAWFVDYSVAIHWYLRDEQTGKRLDFHRDGGSRFYEGKRQNFEPSKPVLHRFMVVDHYTGCYLAQYVYTPGESAEDVARLLFNAMAPKPLEAFPFRGVPRRIFADQGSAFKSGLITHLCGEDGLNVKLHLHAGGNAKASGAVEARHRHWQRGYEADLCLADVRPSDVVALNEQALKYCALANAENPHTRHGRTPLEFWASTITPEQLVECPDRATFFALAASTPSVGTLDNRLWLRVDGRKWLVKGGHVRPKSKVTYRLAPFQEQGIRVWDEHGAELTAELLRFDEAGFAVNGNTWTMDSAEQPGASAKLAPAQTISKAVVAGETEVSVPNLFDDLDRRLAQQSYLTRPGRAWQPTPASPLADEPPMGLFEVRAQVIRWLGRGLSVEEGNWWKARATDGLTESQLQAAYATFTATEEAANTQPIVTHLGIVSAS